MSCVALTSGITQKTLNSLTPSSPPTLLQNINFPRQTTLHFKWTRAGPAFWSRRLQILDSIQNYMGKAIVLPSTTSKSIPVSQ